MKERGPNGPRLFIEGALSRGSETILEESAAHHVARVLRLRPGDALTVFNGRGGEHAATVAAIGRSKVIVRVGAHRALERESPLRVTLAQGVSSGEKMDFTIQKAVELGVAAIQPLLCAKSVVRLQGPRAAARLAHWRRIAIAACEQCGRNRIPEVREAVPLERYAPDADSRKILLSPHGMQSLKSFVPASLTLAVGPEAGFAADEESALERAGFTRVRLGPRILRTETAALAALAALNALRGDF